MILFHNLALLFLVASDPLQQVLGIPVTQNNNTNEAAPCFVSGLKYQHSQQIPREDPCDFCMCLDGEVFCWWQQQCLNSTQQPNNSSDVVDWDEGLTEGNTAHSSGGPSTTEATPTTCTVMGVEYKLGEVLPRETGTCLECECGSGGRVSCSPKDCAGPPDQLRQQSLDMFDVDVF